MPSGPGKDDWSIGEARGQINSDGEELHGSIWRSKLGGAELRGFRGHPAAAAAPWDVRFGAIDARLDQMWGVQQEMQQQQTTQYEWQRGGGRGYFSGTAGL